MPGAERALTAPLARAGSNFYEVTFRNGSTGEVFRASWYNTQQGRIRLTPGNYSVNDDNNGGAVLFAGNRSDSGENILLAVGLVTQTQNGATAGNINAIVTTTTTITFTLTPLSNNIVSSHGTTPAAQSSFQIVGPVNPANLATNNDYTTFAPSGFAQGDYRTFASIAGLPTTGYRSSRIPVYLVPKNATSAGTGNVRARFIIGGPGAATSNRAVISGFSGTATSGWDPDEMTVTYTNDTVFQSWNGLNTNLVLVTGTQAVSTGVFIDGEASTTPVTVTALTIVPDDEDKSSWTTTAGIFTPTAPIRFPTRGIFDVEFETPDIDALTSLAFRIIVNAITPDVSTNGFAPINWFIQGGVFNHRFDEGPVTNSTGGAIVLGIGTTDFSSATINIVSNWP